MQPPKRQIIKTRSQKPYIIARVVLIIIIVAAIVTATYFFTRPHRAAAPTYRVTVRLVLAPGPLRQEALGAGRTAEIPA